MDCAVGVDGQSIPLHQHVENRHRVRQPCPHTFPRPLAPLLQPTHRRQHRQHGFHHHPPIPTPAFAGFLVRWIAIRTVKRHVGEDHHLIRKVGDQRSKGVVSDIRCVVVPGHDQPYWLTR